MTEPRRRPFMLRAARFGWNFASDSDFRSVMLLRWKDPKNLFQPFTDTADDRYPDVFRFAREAIGDSVDRRILSFGCSTGEEVFTLRRYFPLASIKGLDVNGRSIAAAQNKLRRSGLSRIEFEEANSAAREPTAHYDAIFAMAVFRHGGLGATGRDGHCDHLIRFADFETILADLARVLRPGGVLFIANSNFRFGDTSSALSFETIFRSRELGANAATPIFDRDNRHIPDSDHSDIGFRKVHKTAQNRA
jgi:SAM-dependent methyltransferase